MVKNMAALVLAAGYSSRMGWFKPLLPLGVNNAVEKSVGCFLAAGLQDIRVVVGHRASEVIPAVVPLGAKIIENSRYDQEMYSSVLAGVSSLGPEVDAFFLLPGDIPLVKPQTIERLADAFREGGSDVFHPGVVSPGVVYPCYQGERGHPPLISAGYIEGLLAWKQPGGLRAFLSRHESEALDLEVDDRGVVLDMDVPGDYQHMLSVLGENNIPGEADCHVLLKKHAVPDHVVAHSRVVAEVARRLAACINRSGGGVCLDLVVAAGLLHDLAKGKPSHALAAAGMLRELGYPGVAAVVAGHMDIDPDPKLPVGEKEILYLADKLVAGDRPVDLEDRHQSARRRFAKQGDALKAAARRFENARLIREKIEKATGMPGIFAEISEISLQRQNKTGCSGGERQ